MYTGFVVSNIAFSNNVNKNYTMLSLKSSYASPSINQLDVLRVFYSKVDHCSDHCINYALSDPHDTHFQQSCTDHQHDIVCDRCQLLPKAISNLKKILSNLTGNSHVNNGNILMCIFFSFHKILIMHSSFQNFCLLKS